MPTPAPSGPGPSGPAEAHAPLRVAAALAGLFLAAAIALWLIGVTPPRAAGDQNLYHLVAIKQFARDWPAVDLRDYPSATTPGYHLLLALVARGAGDATLALQVAGSVFTIGLLATCGWLVARRTGGAGLWPALGFALPLVGSQYVVGSGVWLLPDNAAWWGVLVMLALALHPPRAGPARWLVAGAVVLSALVFVRQNHVWTAGLLVAAAWLGRSRPPDEVLAYPPLSARDVRLLGSEASARARRALLALLACLPAAAVLFYFVRLWGGLTPPSFQGVLHGGNPATPAFTLALLGLYGVFFAPVLWRPLRQFMSGRPVFTVAALLLGVAMAALPETTATLAPDNRRYGALWAIAQRAPVLFGHTSVLILALAPLGMLAVLALAQGLARRDRWIILTALAGFVAAQSTSAVCWQRYIEPLLLMLLALGAAGVHARYPGPARPRVLGPLLLFALLAGVTVWTILQGA